jgi:hypothetical protein
VRVDGAGFRVFPAEGASPPRVNGKRVTQDGVALRAGDRIEVAGTSLEFVLTDGASGS